MTVAELVGGKCREAVETYAHADGPEIAEAIGKAKELHEPGLSQCARAGRSAGHGRLRLVTRSTHRMAFQPLHDKPLFEPAYAMRRGIKLLEEARSQLGDEVGLLHDMHERYLPNQAIEFAKQVEKGEPVLP